MFADLREARPGDPCPQCDGDLEGARVIEVGNIFQLGTKYSAPMGATFLDEDGKEQRHRHGQLRHRPGAHRRGRRRAAPRRQRHRLAGERSRRSHVHLVLVRASDETQAGLAEQLYAELGAAGFDVLFDDRDLSPGIKFKDADLLGCPAQVVVGKRAAEGVVELKDRAGGERRDVPARSSPPPCASCCRADCTRLHALPVRASLSGRSAASWQRNASALPLKYPASPGDTCYCHECHVHDTDSEEQVLAASASPRPSRASWRSAT